MRIAPKPIAGQGISLDDLLNKPMGPTRAKDGFSIDITDEFMTIHGVQMRDGIHSVAVYYEPLKSHEAPAGFLRDAMEAHKRGEPRPASTLETFEIFSELYRQRERLTVEPATMLLRNAWDRSPLYMFTTYTIYCIPGNDLVIHCRYTDHECGIQGTFGPDGLIMDHILQGSSACEMLFGEPDVTKVHEVFKHFFDQNLSIYSTKKHGSTGAVILGKNFVSCGEEVTGHHSFGSLGIRIIEE